jgi:hypothetical protein
MIIGIDPHKMSHTANAVDPATNTTAASLRIDASLAGYRELMRWSKQFPERRWAVENARGLGRHLAQWLVARGEVVLDVPCSATARVRELSRGSRRKTDVIDAAAAASVAALHGDATVVTPEDHTTVFALLEERRANPAAQRVRIANQLHTVLRDLTPGGAALAITANRRPRCCDRFVPHRRPNAPAKNSPTTPRDRRHRRSHRGPAHRPHWHRITVRIRARLRHLRRHSTDRDRQRRTRSTPALACWRPTTELSNPPHRSHPGPDAEQHRARLLRQEDRRRQDPQRSHAMPQTTTRQPHLANDDRRRTPTRRHQRRHRNRRLTNTEEPWDR